MKFYCGEDYKACLLYTSPDTGEIWFEGKDISKISDNEMRPLRSDIQMVFQDPYGSLNPRMKVQDLIGEPLLIHTNMTAGERLKKVHELLGVVGLSPSHGERYPCLLYTSFLLWERSQQTDMLIFRRS